MEAATILPQFSDTLANFQQLRQVRAEHLLVNILQSEQGKSEVKKAAVRSLIVIYSVAMLYGRDALTSVSLLKELPGIQTVFTLLREALEGNIRTEDDH